jgi:sugar fermentation stimulation protein A
MNVIGKEQDKGTYILLIELANTQRIKPGKLPEADYKKGFYLYVGRARKGLRARINRHLRSKKNIFWHIDSLLQKAKIEVVWIRKNFFDECTIASKIVNFRPPGATTLEGFGSSDCRCPSHLIYFPRNTKAIRSLGNQLGFEKIKIDENKL